MTGEPDTVGVLPGGVEQREPWPGEVEFFRSRPDVTGMVAEDGRVVLNPLCQLTESQKAAVLLNEAARAFMVREEMIPEFHLTQAQTTAFASYGSIQAQRATIAARLLSGDPSALEPTLEQVEFVQRLGQAMNI